MSPVDGKLFTLKAYKTDGYYPFACTSELTLIENTEVLPTTSPASGKFRTYKTRLRDWKLSSRGLLFLKNDIETMWMALDLFEDSASTDGLDIQIPIVDQDGFTKTFEGHVYIPSKTLTGSAGSLVKWQFEFQGSGAYILT